MLGHRCSSNPLSWIQSRVAWVSSLERPSRLISIALHPSGSSIDVHSCCVNLRVISSRFRCVVIKMDSIIASTSTRSTRVPRAGKTACALEASVLLPYWCIWMTSKREVVLCLASWAFVFFPNGVALSSFFQARWTERLTRVCCTRRKMLSMKSGLAKFGFVSTGMREWTDCRSILTCLFVASFRLEQWMKPHNNHSFQRV
jgi:hypothetical protein